MNIKNYLLKTSKMAILAIAVFSSALPGISYAAVTDLNDSPMVVESDSNVKPNITFIMDDSGSMDWSYLPDYVGGFNTSGTWNGVGFGSSSNFCMNSSCGAGEPFYMTPHFNKIYYNPEIMYSVPNGNDAKGVAFAAASTTATKTDGYAVQNKTIGSAAATTTNITTSIEDYEYCNGTSTTDCRRNTSDSGYLYPLAPYTTARAVKTAAYYWAIPVTEYCSDRKLTNCVKSTVSTTVSSVNYTYPAKVRWCNNKDISDTAVYTNKTTTCQANREGTHLFLKAPYKTITETNATIKIPYVNDPTANITKLEIKNASGVVQYTYDFSASPVSAADSKTSTFATNLADAINSQNATFPFYATVVDDGEANTVKIFKTSAVGTSTPAADTAINTFKLLTTGTLPNIGPNNSYFTVTSASPEALKITSFLFDGVELLSTPLVISKANAASIATIASTLQTTIGSAVTVNGTNYNVSTGTIGTTAGDSIIFTSTSNGGLGKSIVVTSVDQPTPTTSTFTIDGCNAGKTIAANAISCDGSNLATSTFVCPNVTSTATKVTAVQGYYNTASVWNVGLDASCTDANPSVCTVTTNGNACTTLTYNLGSNLLSNSQNTPANPVVYAPLNYTSISYNGSTVVGTPTITSTFQTFNGAKAFDLTRNKITPLQTTYTKNTARTDCITNVATTNDCTYAEELQNYANWYSYYKTRMQTMKSATNLSFSSLSEAYRMGLFAINNISAGTGGALSVSTAATSAWVPVSDFNSTQKTTFFNKLYNIKPGNSTPLRTALSGAGWYYAGKLGNAADPIQYSCQQNFSILTTDGYWNGGNGEKLGGAVMDSPDSALPLPFNDGGIAQITTVTPWEKVDQNRTTGDVTTTTPWIKSDYTVGAACSLATGAPVKTNPKFCLSVAAADASSTYQVGNPATTLAGFYLQADSTNACTIGEIIGSDSLIYGLFANTTTANTSNCTQIYKGSTTGTSANAALVVNNTDNPDQIILTELSLTIGNTTRALKLSSNNTSISASNPLVIPPGQGSDSAIASYIASHVVSTISLSGNTFTIVASGNQVVFTDQTTNGTAPTINVTSNPGVTGTPGVQQLAYTTSGSAGTAGGAGNTALVSTQSSVNGVGMRYTIASPTAGTITTQPKSSLSKSTSTTNGTLGQIAKDGFVVNTNYTAKGASAKSSITFTDIDVENVTTNSLKCKISNSTKSITKDAGKVSTSGTLSTRLTALKSALEGGTIVNSNFQFINCATSGSPATSLTCEVNYTSGGTTSPCDASSLTDAVPFDTYTSLSVSSYAYGSITVTNSSNTTNPIYINSFNLGATNILPIPPGGTVPLLIIASGKSASQIADDIAAVLPSSASAGGRTYTLSHTSGTKVITYTDNATGGAALAITMTADAAQSAQSNAAASSRITITGTGTYPIDITNIKLGGPSGVSIISSKTVPTTENTTAKIAAWLSANMSSSVVVSGRTFDKVYVAGNSYIDYVENTSGGYANTSAQAYDVTSTPAPGAGTNASGSFTITSGGSNGTTDGDIVVSSITIDGVEILSAAPSTLSNSGSNMNTASGIATVLDGKIASSVTVGSRTFSVGRSGAVFTFTETGVYGGTAPVILITTNNADSSGAGTIETTSSYTNINITGNIPTNSEPIYISSITINGNNVLSSPLTINSSNGSTTTAIANAIEGALGSTVTSGGHVYTVSSPSNNLRFTDTIDGNVAPVVVITSNAAASGTGSAATGTVTVTTTSIPYYTFMNIYSFTIDGVNVKLRSNNTAISNSNMLVVSGIVNSASAIATAIANAIPTSVIAGSNTYNVSTSGSSIVFTNADMTSAHSAPVIVINSEANVTAVPGNTILDYSTPTGVNGTGVTNGSYVAGAYLCKINQGNMITTDTSTYNQVATDPGNTTISTTTSSYTNTTVTVNGTVTSNTNSPASAPTTPTVVTTVDSQTHGAGYTDTGVPTGATVWSAPVTTGPVCQVPPGSLSSTTSGTPVVDTVNPVTTPISVGTWTAGTSTVTKVGTNGQPNTLADVAAWYYYNDLRTGATGWNNALGAAVAIQPSGTVQYDVSTNNVPIKTTASIYDDNVEWQHMTTFTMGLGMDGNLMYTPHYKVTTDVNEDYYKLATGKTGCAWDTKCNWPTTGQTIQGNVDDLWHAAINGHGTYFSASDPTSVVSGLNEALASIEAKTSTAAAASPSNPNVTSGDNYVFSSNFISQYWSGSVYRQEIDLNTGSVNGSIDWNTNDTMSKTYWNTYDSATSKYNHENRKIYMFNSNGTNNLIDFTYSNLQTLNLDDYFKVFNGAITPHLSNITYYDGTQTGQATPPDAGAALLVNYLRGDSSNEGQANDHTGYSVSDDPKNYKMFRERKDVVLGSIINSEATYVKYPLFKYSENNYSTYKTSVSGRAGTIYVGANDGMLHAFNATNGTEKFAYIPPQVIPNIWYLADWDYKKLPKYSVDGTPTYGDAWDYNSATIANPELGWKSLIVGGLNKGGHGYYAMDVTDPNNPKALWNICDDATLCGVVDDDLGYSYGQPIITKINESAGGTTTQRWVVIITSGYNNTTGSHPGRAIVYILDAFTGQILHKIINPDQASGTNGSATDPLGLAKFNVYSDNPNTDNTGLYIYGGDLYGNLWKVDISGTTCTLPDANGTYSGATNCMTRLGLLKDASGGAQMITAKPELGIISDTKRMVFVGTGKLLGETDIVGDISNPQWANKQTLYGIWDDGETVDIGRDLLQEQVLTQTTYATNGVTVNARSVGTPASVNWGAGAGVAYKGWYIDLSPEADGSTKGERVNVDMSLDLGTLTVVTNIPSKSVCSVGGESYVLFFNYTDGTNALISTPSVAGYKIGDSLGTKPVVISLPNGKVITLIRMADNSTINKEVPISNDSASGTRINWRNLSDE